MTSTSIPASTETLDDKLNRILEAQSQAVSRPFAVADPRENMPNQRFRSFPPRALQFVQSDRWSGEPAEKALHLVPFILQDGILCLHGDRGTGKTCMATWWALKKGRGMYVKAMDLYDLIRQTMFSKAGRYDERDTRKLIQHYRDADYLVIDECHEAAGSDFEQRTLVNLIDWRYDAMKPTVLIGNLTEESLIATLGPSITRRINETGGFVGCNWSPYHVQPA